MVSQANRRPGWKVISCGAGAPGHSTRVCYYRRGIMHEPISAATAAVGALSSSINIVKGMIQLRDEVKASELKINLADLLQRLYEAKDESNALRSEVASLKDKLRVRQAMSFRGGRYYAAGRDGTDDGPFCPKCWDGKDRQCRMVPSEYMEGMPGFQCVVCNYFCKS